MAVKIACSTRHDVAEIIVDIQAQFGSVVPKLIVCFASTAVDLFSLAPALKKRWPAVTTIGCSTAGEIVSGKMLKGSVVAMALDASVIQDAAVATMSGISADGAMREALASLGQHFGTTMRDADPTQYVGIILMDGLRAAEERLMDSLGDLTDVTFIGGSAGDDLAFKETLVFANGEVIPDGAVLALLKPSKGFDFIKTQSFKPLEQMLVASKVNEATREVFEFNGEPALEAYAKAVGVVSTEAANQFMSHPVGLMIGDEPYVRSPQQARGETMVFYCNVLEGMELKLLESTDIIADTRAAIAAAQASGPIAALLNFNCILRTLELEQLKLTDAYGKLFADVPTIGFSTYGEAYIGHINQTATMLVLR